MEHITQKPLASRDPDFIVYAKNMAEAIAKAGKSEKVQKSRELRAYRDTLSAEQKIEFDKSIQAPSMRATMERPKSMDAEWQNRPIPPEVIEQCKKIREAKTDEERAKLVNQGSWDPGQIQIIEAHRKNSKNTLGQSELSATTDQRRLSAIEAFVHSPPAKLTPEERDKLMKMSGYTPPPPPLEDDQVKATESLMTRFINWIKGEAQKSDLELESKSYVQIQKERADYERRKTR